MRHHSVRAFCALSLGIASTLATTGVSRADSLASSASSAGSASVGSLSDSIRGSSRSSTGDNKVADGDYQVIEVAALPGRPDMLTIRMQAVATATATANGEEAGAFSLDLPQKAVGRAPLVAGDVVSVHNRPYGLEFARAQTREPFYLVLTDEWRGNLDARAVTF